MAADNVMVGLAAVIVLGVAAQWLAWRLHVPSILLLLATGFVAGTVTGFLDPDAMMGRALLPLVSLAVGIILFEGGLSLSFTEIRGHGPVVTRLVTLGAAVTWLLAASAAHLVLGLAWDIALLVGAILVVTGPTVVGPLLHHVRPKGDVGGIVKWEGILIDPVGALLAVLVFEAVSAGTLEHATNAIGIIVIQAVLAGGVVGALGALLLFILLKRRWIPHQLESPVTLALVIGVFVAADLLQHESGLFAVTLMGVLLANQQTVPVTHILEFKENLRVLLLAGLFVLLAARLELSTILGLGTGVLIFIGVLMFIVRPVSVLASAWGSGLSWRDLTFISWMAPRGIVAAAVSSVFALRLADEGHPQADLVVPVIFSVIVATVAIYGLTAGPIARALKVASPPPQGILFVGANRFTRTIAREVQRAGHRVLLVDTNPENVLAAASEGLPITPGNAIADEFLRDFDPDGLGRMLAMTPNDEVNALAALTYADWFSRDEVYQLCPGEAGKSGRPAEPSALRGRLLFAAGATWRNIQARLDAGDEVQSLHVTSRFDMAALEGPSGEPPLPILTVHDQTGVRISTVNAPATPRPHVTLVYLGGPPPATRPEPEDAHPTGAGAP